MPWEELPARMRLSSSTWRVSISKKGGIAIWLPDGHPLTRANKIKTLVGTGAEQGQIRLLPAIDQGRSINVDSNGRSCHIKYSTLPGCPKVHLPATEIAEIDVQPYQGDGVQLTLPWYKRPYKSIMGENPSIRRA